MPSLRSRPEGPKYGKEAYFDYFGRHQVYMNFQPSPSFPASCNSRQGSYSCRSKHNVVFHLSCEIFQIYYYYYYYQITYYLLNVVLVS